MTKNILLLLSLFVGLSSQAKIQGMGYGGANLTNALPCVGKISGSYIQSQSGGASVTIDIDSDKCPSVRFDGADYLTGVNLYQAVGKYFVNGQCKCKSGEILAFIVEENISATSPPTKCTE